MRMLGYLHLNLLGIHEESLIQGEHYLLRSYDAGCFFAANDLFMFYLGKNNEKSRFYYQEATRHECRVVFHAAFE